MIEMARTETMTNLEDLKRNLQARGIYEVISGPGLEVDWFEADEGARPPWQIVSIRWVSERRSYYRIGNLLAAVEPLSWSTWGDDTPLEYTVLAAISGADLAVTEPLLMSAIQDVARLTEALELARRRLSACQDTWHAAQPVDFSTFRPISVDEQGMAYGVHGETVSCRRGVQGGWRVWNEDADSDGCVISGYHLPREIQRRIDADLRAL